MNIRQIQSTIERVKYKPNFKFDVTPNYEGVFLTLHIKVPNDVRNPNEPVDLVLRRYISLDLMKRGDTQVILDLVISMIKEFEAHEMNEWLRVDNTHLVEPTHE